MIGKIFLHVLPDLNFQKPYIKWICQSAKGVQIRENMD